MLSNQEPYRFAARLTEEARWSLFLACERDRDLPARVFEAIHNQVVDTLYKRYPRALPLPDDGGWQAGRLRATFGCLVRNLWTDLQADRRPTNSAPRDALVVAVAAMAYLLCGFVPSEDPDALRPPRFEVHIPLDFSVEAMRDTMCVWLGYYSGSDSEMREAIMKAMRQVLANQPRAWEEEAIQSAVAAADLVYGGATPGLVREIVHEGRVCKEAELLFGVSTKAEKERLARTMGRVHEDMQRLHRAGPDLDALATWVEKRGGEGDLVQGLEGQWLTVLENLLPILPPDVATAMRFGKARDVHGNAVRAINRAIWRHDKRAQRDYKRLVSIDHQESEEGETSSRHEVTPDLSAEIAASVDADLDGILDGIELTARERQVAQLLRSGWGNSEIAKKLEISEGRVSQIVNSLAPKLKGRI
jgi:RNA polymerase sigma factor (sigma-70 family)